MKRAKPPTIKESAIVSQCIQWLWAKGCYVWRNNTGGYRPEGSKSFIKFGTRGSADIIGVNPSGRFIGIECKSAKGTLKPEQKLFGDRIKEKGGIYIVARSIDDLEACGELLA